MGNAAAVKRDFLLVSKILPLHRTNYLQDKQIRKDNVFHLLAEKVFDHPALLEVLLRKINIWLGLDRSEFTHCLAGYIYYISEDFERAAQYFFRAIEKNPQNLDTWFDLAFALYHSDDYKLALKILFNFDTFVKVYQSGGYTKCNKRVLEKIAKSIK